MTKKVIGRRCLPNEYENDNQKKKIDLTSLDTAGFFDKCDVIFYFSECRLLVACV